MAMPKWVHPWAINLSASYRVTYAEKHGEGEKQN
jgi:hypothetical protein